MKKIAFLSDTHLSYPYENNSLFPGWYSRRGENGKYLYELHCAIFMKCFDVVTGHPTFLNSGTTATIHLGDVTGGWNLEGIANENIFPVAEKAIRGLKRSSRFLGVCPGNHDLGYRNGQINLESLLKFSELSPVFWSHLVEDVVLIGICSPLLKKYIGENESSVRDIQSDQFDFISDTLRNHPSQRWALCTHSLNVSSLDPVCKPYSHRLEIVVAGDRHSSWSGKLEKAIGYLGFGFENLCKRKATVCPSVAPLWWHGGSCITADVYGDMIVTTTHENLLPYKLQQKIKTTPFNTFLKALLACRHDLPRWKDVF